MLEFVVLDVVLEDDDELGCKDAFKGLGYDVLRHGKRGVFELCMQFTNDIERLAFL